jgi:3-phenylpropionate/trans-cinnamate dioxygenase ferredoxin reductase subunit
VATVSEPGYDILLVGGGIASANAAKELRERGFEGSILLATRELDRPYHRPPITKGYLQRREDRESTLIHPEAWYAEHDVEVRTRAAVMDIDLEARTAKIGREQVAFEKALVATGAGVRRLQAEGGQRENIHYLRALPNADKLHGALDGAERVCVVGGSYIATEVAASLTVLGKACTIVMQEALPLERGFGPVAGQFAHDLLTSHGIEIVAGADVSAFEGEGDDGPVSAVVCADGRRVEADLVVVGVGATPDVLLARKAGLELGESGGVRCDARLRTSADRIWAAGDMCEFESVRDGRRLRIEHEEVAAAQGRHVARAMLGSDEPYDDVPYFWSDLADWATLEYVGNASTGWDDEIVHGDPAAGAFSVWFMQDGKLEAALAVGRTDDVELGGALIVAGASAERVRGALNGT